jgi:hypothetical protein
MRKIDLILFVVIHNYCSGMEIMSYICGKTQINLQQGSHYDADGKVDFIVVGKSEQLALERSLFKQGSFNGKRPLKKFSFSTLRSSLETSAEITVKSQWFSEEWLVGHTKVFRQKWVYVSEKDIGKKLKSKAIEVIEPQLFCSKHSGYYYYVEKRYNKKSSDTFGKKYFGAEALMNVLCDLQVCYNNVLMVGAKKQNLEQQKQVGMSGKSIALPAIARTVYLPEQAVAVVAVPTILKFIKNNPEVYTCIELFVKTPSEFKLYQKLLKHHLRI